MPDDLDRKASAMFYIDKEFPRDRIQYGSYENMPLELRLWWRARAKDLFDKARAVDLAAERSD